MTLLDVILYFVMPLAITALMTYGLIPYFHRKQFGQYIREEGPKAHLKKQGTPTMGGIAIFIGIAAGMAIFMVRVSDPLKSWASPHLVRDAVAIVLTMLAFGAIGFIDDFNKIAKKENLGLTAKQKLIMQAVFSIGLAFYMMRTGREDLFIPFLKIGVSFGLLYIPFVMFVEIAMSNAVNLTDGLDGLAASVTLMVAMLWLIISVFWHEGLFPVTGAAAGALLGFLLFNVHPASVFMGDTGSLALGGFVAACAYLMDLPLLLPLIGIVYVIEVLSVIAQVVYFKVSGGKRLLKMAPLHHHFELCGWEETRIVALFTIITAVMCIAALLGI